MYVFLQVKAGRCGFVSGYGFSHIATFATELGFKRCYSGNRTAAGNQARGLEGFLNGGLSRGPETRGTASTFAGVI